MEDKQSNKINIDDIQATEIKTSSSSQKQESPFNTPTDFVTIPSMGKVYSVTSALHNKEQVEIRHLTAADEDILTSRSLLRSGKAVDVLLQKCLIDQNIKVDELISGDKNAILTYLRVTGYGPEYSVSINCSDCGAEADNLFDLSLIGMNTLSISPIKDGENAFEYKAPSGMVYVFKFLSSGEEREISEAQDKMKKASNSPIDRNVTTRLKASILSINGDTDHKNINDFVDKMPVRDSRAIRKYIEDNTPDLVMKQDYECKSCGYKTEVDVPVTVSFFWPES